MGNLHLPAFDLVRTQHIGDTHRVVAHSNQRTLFIGRKGNVFAVNRIRPAAASLLFRGRRAIHRLNGRTHLCLCITSFLRPQFNPFEKSVAILIIGMDGGLLIKPPHYITIRIIHIGPAFSLDLMCIHPFAGRTDIRFSI